MDDTVYIPSIYAIENGKPLRKNELYDFVKIRNDFF